MFWNRNREINSKEFEDLVKRIGSLRADIEDLKAKVEKFEVRLLTSKKKEKIPEELPEEMMGFGDKEKIESYLRSQGFIY